MPLRKDRFNVYLSGRDEPVYVEVTHQDQLRAETAMAATGTDYRMHPLHLTDAWLWAALLRTGELPQGTKLRDFQMAHMVGLEELGAEGVDPTQQGAPAGGASDSVPLMPFPASTGGPARTTD